MIALLFAVLGAWTVLIAYGRMDLRVANALHIGTLVMVVCMLVASHVSGMVDARDRVVYVRQFEVLADAPTPWGYGYFEDPLFNVFLWSMARILPANEFALYGVISLTTTLLYYFTARLLLPNWASYLALITILASSLIVAYSSVAIRQGLAITLIGLAGAMYASRRGGRAGFLTLVMCAGLLHWSAVFLGVVLVAIWMRTPQVRTLAWAWALLAVSFSLGLSRRVLSGITPEVEGYTQRSTYEAYGSMTARYDFLAVSGVILIGALIARRWLGDADLAVYDRLVAAYVGFNSVFLVFGFIAYSDRLAAYSWFLTPLLVWYPLGKRMSGGSLQIPLAATAALALGLVTGSWAALAG